MQQINALLALEEAKKRLALQTELARRPELPLSALTQKMVTLLFTRMIDLFSSKADSRGIRIYSDPEKGIYSQTFELWCRKLSDLSPDDFKRGMNGLECKAEQDYREGHELWPPSYAEFRALAFPATTQDESAHKILPSVFDPKTAHLFLEDQIAKQKRIELGLKHTSELLSMFEE